MVTVLSLITSALWGSADFFGGLASRRESVFRVMLWVHLTGLAMVAALAPLLADRIIGADLLIGALAGVVGLVGLLLLYWGLAEGPMTVVAPLSAVISALVPVLWGLRSDEVLSGMTMAGLLLGLVAVLIISLQPGDSDARAERAPHHMSRVIAASLVAGACFGTIVLLYDTTDTASAPWPIVSGRFVTTVILVLITLGRAAPLSPGSTLGLAALTGVGDTLANITLLYAAGAATGSTELSVVAVITALYPAATVIWARVTLDELIGRTRLVGLATAAAAIVLMVIG